MNPVVNEARAAIAASDLPEATLIRDAYAPESFGDGEAVFAMGELLLRVVRDRGQYFVDVASTVAPETFYKYEDLAVALGWITLDSALERTAAEPLPTVLRQPAGGFPDLQRALSPPHEPATRKTLDAVAASRRAGRATRNCMGEIYFLSSLDYSTLEQTRQCTVVRRLRFNTGKECVLADVSPPIPGPQFGFIEDIVRVLLAVRHEGASLSPIDEFPCFVFVTIPLTDIDSREVIEKDEVQIVAWGELYRTRDDADNHVFDK